MFLRYLAHRFLHSLCAAVDCSLYDWPERLSDYEAEREVIEAQEELLPSLCHGFEKAPYAPMSDGQAVSGVEETARLGSNPPTPAGPPTSAK